MSFATQAAIEEYKRQQIAAAFAEQQKQRMEAVRAAYVQQAIQEEKQKELDRQHAAAYARMSGVPAGPVSVPPSGLAGLEGLRMGWGSDAAPVDVGDESDGSCGASDDNLDSDDDTAPSGHVQYR